ncbi:Hypothetical protein A7982_01321 [Minicystis rosea]|nr:Hypothetical protein A7982_01321 [Minicystis rosea]
MIKRKNLTPFLVGAKVTSRTPPRPEMVVIVRAKFSLRNGEPPALPDGHPVLAQGSLRGDVFRDDDDDQTGECLYASDFADWKPRADVLLRGTCHTPGKKRMTECPVRFAVGSWSKILRVVGHRVWMDGLLGPAMSDPVPFDRMPIDDRHAFGGPGHPQNPVGRGLETRELPNVEHADDVLRSRSDRPSPAGFGPWSPNRPERRARIGKKYGEHYRKHRAPYYAEDFDWAYFNAAPLDQRIPYLRGDEELVFQNLHPSIEVFRSRLPGLRIRAFAADPGGELREVAMVLDTLFADLDEGSLYLTWRGLTPVSDSDLSEHTVLVASEKLDEAPLPDAHYREIHRKFEADPLELEEQLPLEVKEDWHALVALGKQRAGEAPPPDTTGLDPVSALVKTKLGGLAKPLQAKISAVMKALWGIAMPGQRLLGAIIEEALRDQQPAAAPSTWMNAGVPPMLSDPGLRRSFQTLVKAVQTARKSAADQGRPLQGMEPWDKLLQDPKLASMGLRAVEPKKLDGVGPGADLSGQDLSDQDLRGKDLSGANLTGAILSGADLTGAKLRGAKLKQAVLLEAELGGADLTGADLGLAILSRVRAEGAVLRDTTLDYASFEGAHLVKADLSGSHGEQLVLSRADMSGAIAKGVKWHMALVEGAKLAEADFSEAGVTRSFFSKCAAEGAIFAGATLTGTSFAGSDLTSAIFHDARGDGSIWMGATLTGADMAHTIFKSAHFTEVIASGARFFGANLRKARFYRATLERADFTRANLFDADLHGARVAEAKFVDANLYDAKLYETSGSGCDFNGANLKKSTLERDL